MNSAKNSRTKPQRRRARAGKPHSAIDLVVDLQHWQVLINSMPCGKITPRYVKLLAALALEPGVVLKQGDIKRNLVHLKVADPPMVPSAGKIRAGIVDLLSGGQKRRSQVDTVVRIVRGEGVALDLSPQRVRVILPDGSSTPARQGTNLSPTSAAAASAPGPSAGYPVAPSPRFPYGPVSSRCGSVEITYGLLHLPTRLQLTAAVTAVRGAHADKAIPRPPWRVPVPNASPVLLEAIEGDPINFPEVDELPDIEFEMPVEAIRLNTSLVVKVRDLDNANPATAAQAIVDHLAAL